MTRDVDNEQSNRARDAAAAHRQRVEQMNAGALAETRGRLAEAERRGLENAARRLAENNRGMGISGADRPSGVG